MTERTEEEVEAHIKQLLEDNVKPAVAAHGGEINFISYSKGHLVLELSGSCSGCAGSTFTLKMGVENMLKHLVPEFETLEAYDDPYTKANPYYTNPFADDEFIELSEDRPLDSNN